MKCFCSVIFRSRDVLIDKLEENAQDRISVKLKLFHYEYKCKSYHRDGRIEGDSCAVSQFVEPNSGKT